MIDQLDFLMTPLLLSLKLAFLSACILLMIVTPTAWWLAKTSGAFKSFVEVFLTLPMVLPPSVLGFYLLVLLGKNGFIGQLSIAFFDVPMAFSFWGLLLGSVVYSFPYVMQPIIVGFEGVRKQAIEVALSLGSSPLQVFWSVAIPLCRHSLLMGWVMGFAHTLGEFGVVLMIGGSIPGETKVMSIAIYDYVEAFDYSKAHLLAGVLLFFSFAILGFLAWLRGRFGADGMHV